MVGELCGGRDDNKKHEVSDGKGVSKQGTKEDDAGTHFIEIIIPAHLHGATHIQDESSLCI